MLHRLFSSVPGDKLSDSRLPEVPDKKVYADVLNSYMTEITVRLLK